MNLQVREVRAVGRGLECEAQDITGALRVGHEREGPGGDSLGPVAWVSQGSVGVLLRMRSYFYFPYNYNKLK
jgi:hypothetical protein